ncbi:RNA polymerase II transcription factor SIII subunit A-domain-containing protein [Fusarium redolens]|uniref:RNA polymerase II transcription factor SIII subunit A-domain-containing protein n=1 Tax=Fusarium redolens TaxID=48865 RepID=A0A9P9KXG3_FUSRE|nr:RNA polymerase II transcription factor SIII subunit A-domain-containing protein [Fusarium redolens]KAH7270221.1 RNA polymerase II transcription factor SIII subunit A-domain-containing protein [Fusarium redolens]
MPAKSLLELATAACIKNIRELDSVGDYLPYKAVRLLLLKIDNAKQLRTIELNSPQIQGETGEVWLKLIKHEFPMEVKQKAYKPPNPTKWYRVYEKYKSDHQKALLESEAKLKDALMGLREDKEKNTSKIVDDRRLLPRGGRIGPKKAWGFGARDPNGSTLAFNRGSRTKTHNGASVMRKVRRETKEIASIHGALSRPTQASNAITKLRKAPAAMVNDYQRAARPTLRPPPPPPPKPTIPDVVETHEARAQYISDSDSDDGDDLFDDEKPSPRRKVASPLKKPAAGPSESTSKVKRTGLLSNSYKGPKPQTATSSRPRLAPQVRRSPSPVPPQKQISLSPEPAEQSSPTRATNARPPLGIGPRKRKATDVFMKPKKRA